MPAIVAREYRECRKLFDAENRRLADQAFHHYGQNIHERLYLYGVTRDGNVGRGYFDLTLIGDMRDDPRHDGFELVINEHVPRNLPIESLASWFEDHLRRTPHWAFCD